MASLADARLEDVQSRMGFLWRAAHSPLAQTAPLVAGLLLRSLRKLAAQEDVMMAHLHTTTSFCSGCCAVRLPGTNCRARVEASACAQAAQRKKERRRKRVQLRKEAAAAVSPFSDASPVVSTAALAAAAAAAAAVATPKKRHRDSSPFSAKLGNVFATPASGRSTAAAAPNTPVATAKALSAASTAPTHELVLRCLLCGQRDRVPGQSAQQKQLLRVAPAELEALEVHTSVARNEAEASKLAAQVQAEADAAARESAAKRQKLLHSLQTQSQPLVNHPGGFKAPRATATSLEQLALAQQRLAQAVRGGDVSELAAGTQSGGGSFFSEQLQGVVAPRAPTPSAAPVPAAAATPAPPAAAAPFTFSRSGSAPAAGVKKPSLHELLRGAAPAPVTVSSAGLSLQLHAPGFPSAAAARPAASPPPSAGKKGTAAQQQQQAAGSSMQGIAIFGGIKPAGGPSAPFSFSKQSGKPPAAAAGRKSR